jgi:hypothetical protein
VFFRTGLDQRRKSAVVRGDKPPRKNESDKRKTNHVKKTPHNFQPTPHFPRRNRDFCMENHTGPKRPNFPKNRTAAYKNTASPPKAAHRLRNFEF